MQEEMRASGAKEKDIRRNLEKLGGGMIPTPSDLEIIANDPYAKDGSRQRKKLRLRNGGGISEEDETGEDADFEAEESSSGFKSQSPSTPDLR